MMSFFLAMYLYGQYSVIGSAVAGGDFPGPIECPGYFADRPDFTLEAVPYDQVLHVSTRGGLVVLSRSRTTHHCQAMDFTDGRSAEILIPITRSERYEIFLGSNIRNVGRPLVYGIANTTGLVGPLSLAIPTNAVQLQSGPIQLDFPDETGPMVFSGRAASLVATDLLRLPARPELELLAPDGDEGLEIGSIKPVSIVVAQLGAETVRSDLKPWLPLVLTRKSREPLRVYVANNGSARLSYELRVARPGQSLPPEFRIQLMGGGFPSSKPISVFLNGGTPAATDVRSRTERLSAIVALTWEGQHLCTGTLVSVGSHTEVVTAAHCLFDSHGRPRTQIVIKGIGELAAADPSLNPMGPCLAASSFSDCASSGVPDTARVEFRNPQQVPDGLTAWNECREPPKGDSFVAFGYGLDRGRLPGRLLEGIFRIETRPQHGAWRGEGVVGQSVAAGDSGGPAITEGEDDGLTSSTPSVCLVVSAVQVGDPDDPRLGGVVRSLFQPVTPSIDRSHRDH